MIVNEKANENVFDWMAYSIKAMIKYDYIDLFIFFSFLILFNCIKKICAG